jgi:hypothetical protein
MERESILYATLSFTRFCHLPRFVILSVAVFQA